MNRNLQVVVVALAIAGSATTHAEAGDPAKGEQLWKRCRACHQVGEGAESKVGPVLNAIIGRKAGVIEGFRYSKAMTRAGEDGLIWDNAALDAFLAKPKDLVPGTLMSFAGFKDAQDRADMIAFLATFSEGSSAGEAAGDHLKSDDPEATAGLVAQEGDRDYGEYLSATCVTCHQISGEDKGIPSITAWPEDVFKTVMNAYRVKARTNLVMQQVAGSLNDEEIEALAVYFGDLQPAE